MNDQQKKEPKEPLKISLGFEETLEAMLRVKPETPPEPKAKTKKSPAKKPRK